MGMNYSYWERESFLGKADFCVVGAGIVGLNAAIRLKELQPSARVVVLERGLLPDGASTKNAGFACFGSPSELLDDLSSRPEDEVFGLVGERWKGLGALRDLLGDAAIGYEGVGGFEVFKDSDSESAALCVSSLSYLNKAIESVTGLANCYHPVAGGGASFGFAGIGTVIQNRGEGLIDTGKMARSLLDLARSKGVEVWFGMEVDWMESVSDGRSIHLVSGLRLQAGQVVLAVNGFAKAFLPDLAIEPARAQVFVTQPLSHIPFTGGFHYEQGYYYFRNIGNRILLGGGRNLDFEAERTAQKGLTPLVQASLETLMREVILPGQAWEIDLRWSGTMGVGPKKSPIVQQLADGLYAAVRLGGMGVALGTHTGRQVADLIFA